MSDTPEDPDRRTTPVRGADLNVLQYQVGALQTALDRGIGSLEKTIDKGFEQVTARMDRHEARLKTIEERQAFDAARLKALEQFREEQDRREEERRKVQEVEMRAAVDNSQLWKTGRWLAAGVLFLFTLASLIVAIVNGVL